MGDISNIDLAIGEMALPCRESAVIAAPPHWRDHHFQGQPVLPAVVAMGLLAGRMHSLRADFGVQTLDQVRFPKFLPIDPAKKEIRVLFDISSPGQGEIRLSLATRTTSKRGAISRTVEHAAAQFSRNPRTDASDAPSWDQGMHLSGRPYQVDPQTIYSDLVPFGPAFRSICGPLAITAGGAVAEVQALGADSDPLLGSPFPLDGALHAACVWGQRHAGIVSFPVGIRRRTVCMPTRPGERYLARIAPVKHSGQILTFDIMLRDHEGRLREVVQSVEMRDVSRGRWLPPAWIIHHP